MDSSIGREERARAAARRAATLNVIGPAYQPSIRNQALGSSSHSQLLRGMPPFVHRRAQSVIIRVAIQLDIARVERDGRVIMN